MRLKDFEEAEIINGMKYQFSNTSVKIIHTHVHTYITIYIY